MGRTLRILTCTLGTAGLAFVGAQSGALANQTTSTCSHGVVAPSSGHRSVEYLSSRNVEDAHIHKYRHNTGFFATNHTAERNC
jgi:hypothetical protein